MIDTPPDNNDIAACPACKSTYVKEDGASVFCTDCGGKWPSASWASALADVENPLTTAESEQLGQAEQVIKDGLQTFVDVGNALFAIRDGRWYRGTHATFEDYCQDQWGMTRRRANQLIGSAEVVTRLGTIVPIPANEGQARALSKFDEDLQPAIMRAAEAYSHSTGKPLTAGMIERTGEVFTEATTTGYVDTGSGEGNPVVAAVTVTEFEATQRLRDRTGEFYQTHDAQGRVTPAERERRVAAEDLDDNEVLERARRIERERKEARRAERTTRKTTVPADLPAGTAERFNLHLSSVADLARHVPESSVDWLITDPPYPKEFLPVYSDLAAFAIHALKPGGSLLCMIGQSYLPEVLQRLLEAGLTYHWTVSYLTPGGQAVQLWDRKVNTFWKPVLWLTKGEYAGDWIGDVTRSSPNDNDKEHHHWGQSESGMKDLIERFTYPGDTICDPFLGGGTTAVVSLALNRLFIGADIDEIAITTTTARLLEVAA